MNSADVFSLEFDVLTRSSALAGTLEWFRGNALGAATHRQLLLELNYVINVHSRLREIAADVVPAEDWSAWQELLSGSEATGARVQSALLKLPVPAPLRLKSTLPAGLDLWPGATSSTVTVQTLPWLMASVIGP